jgi:hypothetical protein
MRDDLPALALGCAAGGAFLFGGIVNYGLECNANQKMQPRLRIPRREMMKASSPDEQAHFEGE